MYQFTLILLSVIVISYTSNILGENGVGKYSFSQTLNSYFVIFATLSFTFYGQREIATCRNDIYKRSIVFWEIFLCRLIFVVLLCFTNFVLIFLGVFGSYSILMIVLSLNIISVAFDVSFFFYGNEEFTKVILVNIIIKILSTIGIFVFVKGPGDIWLYNLINVLVTFLSNIVICFLLKKRIVIIKLSELRPLKHLNKVLILSIPGIIMSLYNIIDNSLIGFIAQSNAENGYYAQSEKIVRKILLLVNCLSVVMLPKNTYDISCGKYEQVRKSIYKSIYFIWFLGLPIVCGIIISAKNFIPWFLGDSFDKSIILTEILSLLIIFTGIRTVIGEQYLLPNKKDKKYMIATLSGVIVSVCVNIPLIILIGSLGSALTSVISEFVIMVVILCFVSKELSLKKIFKSMVKPLLASVIMGCAIFPLAMILNPGIKNTFIIIGCGMLIYFISILILRDELVMDFLHSLKLKKIARIQKKSTEISSVNGKLIEEVDIYDESMNLLGQMEKDKAHQDGMWHKSVHLWITDGQNVLLQLRSAQKKNFPNKWDISVAGHVSAGESPLQALQREYHEELGLVWDFGDINEECILKSGTIENNQPAKEFLYLYFIKKDIDLTKINLPKDEVAEVRYIPYIEFIDEFMKQKNEYIPYPENYKEAVKNGLEKIIKKGNENE